MPQISTLENGVRILTEYIPHVRSASIGVWIAVGSRDEPEDVSGISHFIEHVLFKGTERRTAKEIAEALDAVGGQLNAFTTKEYTCYHAKVLDEYFPLAVDILTDMLFFSCFNQDDIEREKNVIVEEIKMYEDAPDELVHDVLASTLWQGHALGRPIIGHVDVVQRLLRDDLRYFYGRHYRTGRRVVIAAAGNIDHARVVSILSPVFADLSGTARERELKTPVGHGSFICRNKETEQVHLCLGTQGLALNHECIYQLQVLNTILGGGISSRLFQRIREDLGLVYSIYSYHSAYRDTGVFAIYAGLSAANVDRVLDLICAEIEDIRTHGITSEELKRSQDQLKGNFLLSLESVNARMSRLGKYELYLGRVPSPEEVVARVQAVTVEEVRDLARRLLRPEKMCLAAIGPWTGEDGWHAALGRLK
ncbi:MAG: pitrilysin family protein [Thermoanaerobacterales bacterium]|nr:pitrilysin family protein [Thermoanaerobacterales bacterium]